MLSAFLSEREALTHPENGPALVAALNQAKERAARLKSDSARWQQTLSDGIADVTGEVDFDLKGRFRRLAQEVDDYIDSIDPGDAWTQLEEWLQQRVAWEISQNYLMMAQMSKDLTERVSDHFAMAEAEIADATGSVQAPTEAVGAIEITAKIEAAKLHIGNTALTVLRGGYSGTSPGPGSRPMERRREPCGPHPGHPGAARRPRLACAAARIVTRPS